MSLAGSTIASPQVQADNREENISLGNICKIKKKITEDFLPCYAFWWEAGM